jgi:lipid-A-disaccharide synthase
VTGVVSAETKPGGGRQVMIVAGEASGDMHGAGLVRAMHRLDPTLRFSGMGGRELRAAGVEILVDAAGMAVVGAVEVLSHLGEILRARRSLIARLHSDRPDLLILIDYPDFNLLLAARAKRLGIPILYYISPQVWAWRKGRVRTIRRLVDRMLVILPFEREFYARHGVAVDFVGHPLVDTVRAALDRDRFARLHGIDPARTLVGLLPGSRRKEVATLLPVFLAAAERLEQTHPGRCTFLIPQASTIDRDQLDRAGLAAVSDDGGLRRGRCRLGHGHPRTGPARHAHGGGLPHLAAHLLARPTAHPPDRVFHPGEPHRRAGGHPGAAPGCSQPRADSART